MEEARSHTVSATNYIGKPMTRVDGIAKVKGEAKYAGEYNIEGLLHGVVVNSPIARGRILRIDARDAMAVEGIIKVYSHENVKELPWFDIYYKDMNMLPGSPFRPFYDNEIQFSQQPVALVIAETLELARYGASLIRIQYEKKKSETNLEENLHKSFTPKQGKAGFEKPSSRGNALKVLEQCDEKVEAVYFHGAQHHNPMEMFSSTVIYESDGSLMIYDKTQGVLNSQSYVARVFDIKHKKVRVLSPFVGGAFGSGLRPQYQLFMAAMAALDLKQPVRVTLTRQQMFSFGHRPITWQQVTIGAMEDGKLSAIHHKAISETSRFENYTENIVNWSGRLYTCNHVELDYKLVSLDVNTPLDMRAPGAATGVIALEAAMDEMAYQLKMDPLEFRMRNYTEEDPEQNQPFTSKNLIDCYRQAAEHFGWKKRSLEPRSMKEGHHLIGWGMASGMWDAMMMPARAEAAFYEDGKLVVTSATSDIGTGTYTIMTQIAAETLGLPIEDVVFQLGDSKFVFAPYEGGSSTAASVGTAVMYACNKIKKKLFKLGKKPKQSPLSNKKLKDVTFRDGRIFVTDKPELSVSLTDVMKRTTTRSIRKKSNDIKELLTKKGFSRNTHSAIFVEVKVDEALGMVSVTRVVSAVAAGRILNPKTARSQIMGGIIWGISMALHEDSFLDHKHGRFMNHDYAEYHIPVHADTPEIDVIFVREDDGIINPLGVKGIGEIGIIGVAAAVSNAVFHATGKRMRKFPITPEKLL